MKRKPVFIVNVLVNSITHASAQKTARHHAGGPVEPFDAKLHDVSESERVTVEGLAMPDGMCSFVSVDDLDLEFDVTAFLEHMRTYDPADFWKTGGTDGTA